jgi:hypothetical protein
LQPMSPRLTSSGCFFCTQTHIYRCCHMLHGRGCNATPMCSMPCCEQNEHPHLSPWLTSCACPSERVCPDCLHCCPRP